MDVYLHEATNQNDFAATTLGITTLVTVIILLDQLVWRPLLTWPDRFKVEMAEEADPPRS